MAETDERLTRITDLIARAEGYLSDAEFREDQESRVTRYFQAMNSTLLAVAAQNQLIIELLTKQQSYGGPPGT
jgi:hypothetical protein